ncbi:hypothetical protein FQR65_LT16192 [Abscondita terminalis]|nr:hypothetical protein FQR65_LT16192 [Abscondita terminalis]
MDHFLNRVVPEQQGQGRIRRPRAPRAPRAPRQPRQPRPRPYQYPPVVPTHASTAQAEQEDDDYEIISLSPGESVQENDGHDPIVAPSSPQEDLFEQEIPAQAAVEKYSAPTVRVQSAGVELVENILEMDQKRKVAVEKLEQIYANIGDVRAALKNIREQKNKKK